MQTSEVPKGWWKPEDAMESYRRRRHRSAVRDGAAGAILAADAYTSEAMGDWYREAESRVTKGVAPVPPKPFPNWVRLALILGADFVDKSEGNQWVFQQLVTNPPLPELHALMAAFAEGERSAVRARWAELGERYRAACGVNGKPFAPDTASCDLGVIAAHGGRLLIELVREVRSQRGRGHPTDRLVTNFIKGVAATYECESMGKPMPLDLAEVAVAWGVSQGPQKRVHRLWKSRAEEFWKRVGAGEMPSTQ
jgi:hypothetical protein